MRRMVFAALFLIIGCSTALALLPNNIQLESASDTKFFFSPEPQTYTRRFYIQTDTQQPWMGLTPTMYFYDALEGGNRTAHFCGESGVYSPQFTATEDGNGWYTFTFDLGAGVDVNQATTRVVLHVQANASTWQEFTLYEASPDLNGDLRIGLADLSIYSGIYYGTYDSRADFDHDGSVGLADTGILSSHYGESCE